MDKLEVANLIKAARTAAVAGDHEEAVRLYRQALALQPDDTSSWMALAALLSDAGEKKEAIERVLSIDPFHEEARAALARLDGSHMHEPVVEEEVLTCANHPNRETMLRCNRCNKPICMDCAILTPVGYRCRECVRGQQDKFYTATTSNQVMGYAGAIASGLLLGGAALLLGSFLRFGFLGFILAFFLGPAIGGALGELIWRAAGRKRSRNFHILATVLTAAIAAPIALLSGNYLVAALIVGLAVSAVYARLR